MNLPDERLFFQEKRGTIPTKKRVVGHTGRRIW